MSVHGYSYARSGRSLRANERLHRRRITPCVYLLICMIEVDICECRLLATNHSSVSRQTGFGQELSFVLTARMAVKD